MPYSFSTKVDHVDYVMASHINDLQTAVTAIRPNNESVQQGTYAARPAAGNAGSIYLCTDVGLFCYDNGTTWVNFQDGLGGLLTVPPSASWTTSTLGSATFAADKDGRLLTIPSATGDNWRIEYRTLANATPYTVTAYIDYTMRNQASFFSGLVLRDASGNLVTFGIGYDGTPRVVGMKWTSITAYSADYLRSDVTQWGGIPKWFRIRDDGTNRYCEFSFNGLDWVLFHSVGRTDFLTATQVGWGANFNATGYTNYMRLQSFLET